MNKEVNENSSGLTDMQEISGAGKFFLIGDEKFEVLPATLEQLEEVADLYNDHVHPVMIANFIQSNSKEKDKEGKDAIKNRDALYKLLDTAFAGKVLREKLRKLRRDQVREILDFFLID
jgi:hypothetical protein